MVVALSTSVGCSVECLLKRKDFAVKFCVHFVKVVSLVYNSVTRPLPAGSITMLSSFFSRFSARCSSFIKLLSGIEADCTVEAILLLMLSLADSDKSR